MNIQPESADNNGRTTPPSCIVCRSMSVHFFIRAEGRDYYHCQDCQATFLLPEHRLALTEEHSRYRQHCNHPDDPDYRHFLSRLANPLLGVLGNGKHGLDYGCGPGPVLAEILKEHGHRMNLYDPLFFPDQKALERRYDFITCTETAEHFHQPAEEFALFDRLLQPGGWLAVMTCFQTDDTTFANWHYRRDPTHVVFYREETFNHLAKLNGWACQFPAKNVVLLYKN